MTTQELKEYIGRVLGNSIRCLLPSYWWKRLFGLVVDKVEEVEGSIVSSLDEFAKERPDIEMRTFYVSEDAELVAHNVQVFQTLMRDSAKKKIGPYYIATTIDEDQQVWWIRNDSFYPTGVGAMPTFIIEEDSKKYVVIFFLDGAYIKQETEDDPSNDKVDEERTFYLTTAAESEAAQKNLALYEKMGKEANNTIIKPVYIAYYMYNYFPTTVAQWGILGIEAGAGELIRFYDVFTSSIDSKYKTDLVLMTDGTLEVREPYFSVRGDLELKKNAKTPIANSVATKELYKSARAIMIKGALDTEEMHADNAKIHYSIRNGEPYRPIIITDYSTTYLVTHRELTGGVEDPIRFVGITYNYQYGEYDLRYIQILLNADGTVTEEKGGSLEGNAEVPDISGLATKEELDAKQDKIADLETIRSGAAKGATALQSYTEKYTGTYSKPSTGIPKADLDSTVQTSLGKADTALQSVPDTYATKTNLAEALAPIGTLYKGAWTATKTEGISQLYTERITVPAGTYIICAVLPYAKVGHGNQICINFTAKMAIGTGATFLDASYGCTTQMATFTTTTSLAVMSAASANSAEWDYLDRGGIAAVRIK